MLPPSTKWNGTASAAATVRSSRAFKPVPGGPSSTTCAPPPSAAEQQLIPRPRSIAPRQRDFSPACLPMRSMPRGASSCVMKHLRCHSECGCSSAVAQSACSFASVAQAAEWSHHQLAHRLCFYQQIPRQSLLTWSSGGKYPGDDHPCPAPDVTALVQPEDLGDLSG